MEKPPQYVTPPPDPQYEALKAQAGAQQDSASQTMARADTASLMARYGALTSYNGAQASLPFTSAPANSDLPPSAMPISMAMQMVGNNGNAGPMMQQLFRS